MQVRVLVCVCMCVHVQIAGGGTRSRRGSDAAALCTVQPQKSMEELEREVISLQDSLQVSLRAEQDAREAEKWARDMIESLQFQLDKIGGRAGDAIMIGPRKGGDNVGMIELKPDESGGRAGGAIMIGPRQGGDNVGMIEMKKEELASMHAQIATAASVVNSLKTSLESERSKVETLQKVRGHASMRARMKG